MATKKRLIDANTAQAVLMNVADLLMEAGNPEMAGAVGYAAEAIGKQPTVDAVEVVHGRWEPHPLVPGFVRCSACCDCITYDEWPNDERWKYCPHCGAKMDK